jgi:hypothetical protein
MADESDAPVEGDREWRELTQRTNEQAEKLQPPHDDDAERGSPSPVDPSHDG